jgi:signal transduction histidine kinase
MIANVLGAKSMKPVRRIYERAKNFFIKYPAVLSGLFIYSYLLFCIVHYFVKVKYFTGTAPFLLENVIDSFDAFPFMWLLSVVLVKIIEIRTKLHESEERRMRAQQEIQLHQTQLKTLHEVTRGIQHHINNPLSIIMLTLGSAHKAAADNPKMTRQLNIIDEEVNRIIAALSDFSKVDEYTVESVDPHVGDIATRGIGT